MRPRISTQEAKIIVECLKALSPMIEAKQQRLAELKKELPELRKLFIYEYSKATKANYFEKKKELENLKRNSLALYEHLNMMRVLLAKYQAIADGVTHKGTYKHHSSVINDYFIEPNKTILEVLV